MQINETTTLQSVCYLIEREGTTYTVKYSPIAPRQWLCIILATPLPIATPSATHHTRTDYDVPTMLDAVNQLLAVKI